MTSKFHSTSIPTASRRARKSHLAGSLLGALLASLAHGDTVELAPVATPGTQDFGSEVAGIPDIDNDGVADFIVGAYGRTVNGLSQAGAAVVYSGRTALPIRTHVSPIPQLNGFFGSRLAGVGDLNGDGRGEYLVAATNEFEGQGRVYLYSGANGVLLRMIVPPTTVGMAAFGTSMTAAPDISGDLVSEYLVGAPFADAGALPSAGQVYLYNGATGALMRTITSPNPTDDGQFGYSVTATADIDGDQRGDYAIGAPEEDAPGVPADSGRAYAFSGATGALLRTYLPTEPQVGAQFGLAVHAIPDITGDGRSELAIGSPNADVLVSNPPTPVSNAGIAEFFSFGKGSFYQRLTAPAANIAPNASFGVVMAGLRGASNGALGGVLLGEPNFERVYVAKLDEASPTLEITQTLTPPNTPQTEPFWGQALASAGDVNGDGRDDFLIGSPLSFNRQGRAYLYRQVFNDGCGTVFTPLPVLEEGANLVSTLGATPGSTIANCTGWSGNPGPDTWYRFTATCTGPVTFSTCDTTFDTLLAVYDGCSYTGPFLTCNLSVLLGCNDDASGCANNGSRITVNALVGECFFVRLSGFDGESGIATMQIDCGACPADLTDDRFVDAADLSVLLSNWGVAAGDVNGDGVTNASDISSLLGSWGACP